jgi:hypothetical protein
MPLAARGSASRISRQTRSSTPPRRRVIALQLVALIFEAGVLPRLRALLPRPGDARSDTVLAGASTSLSGCAAITNGWRR